MFTLHSNQRLSSQPADNDYIDQPPARSTPEIFAEVILLPGARPATSTTLAFPGTIPRRQFRVLIANVDVWLTPAPLEMLVNLALLTVTTETGLTPLPDAREKCALQKAVNRLRDALDDALGDGAGDSIIRHFHESRYFLDGINVITCDPLFIEIAHGAVAEAKLKKLLAACPWERRQI